MNSDQLLKFKAISDYGTLTKAAEHLYVSQPALSYSLSSLEKELGCNLFNREKNNLILNENGKLLLPYAEQLSSLLSRAEFALEEKDNIRLSSNNICAAFILSCYPQELLPYVQLIKTEESNFGEMLLKGSLDAATCDSFYIKKMQKEYPEVQFERHILCKEELGVIIHEGHPFFSRPFLTYADLKDIPLCVHHDNQSFILWLDNIQETYNAEFKIVFSMDHCTHYYLRDRIDYPEIAIRNSIIPEPIHETGRTYRFIKLKDDYSTRNIYLWNLRDNAAKVRPLVESIKAYYSTNSPLRRPARETQNVPLYRPI